MNEKAKKNIPTADEIAAMADRGENVSKHFSGKWEMRAGLPREDVQRVNVDFTREILTELDSEAKRLNVSRQAIIKTMLADALDRRARMRNKKRHLSV